jgi:peptide/nickel transport system substrate-binding protein
MRSRVSSVLFVLVLAAGMVAAGGWAAGQATRPASPAKGPSSGGTITETVTGGQWPTLDPATDSQDAADAEYFNLIYGELFQAGPKGKLVPDLATGYRYTDGDLQLDITIRPGATFSDGTPYTAADVAWSINRDLTSPMAQIDFPNFDVVSLPITSSGNTVTLNLKSKDLALISAFITSAPNWTVDQAALNRMGGTAYGQMPVGAGPFKVTSNSASSKLDLVKNTSYWQAGHPLLSGMNILSVGEDNSSLAAMQSGTSQVAMFFSSIPLVRQVQRSKEFDVIVPPSTFYQFVSLNETKPPFNNIMAREALIYATNAKVLVNKLYSNFYPVVEGPTAPGELFFYGPDVPGYMTYDLAKAKALVKKLGGLNVDLATTSNNEYWLTEAEALSSEWGAAGIKTHIILNTLQETLLQLSSNQWQALDSNWGGFDPGLAMPYYFSSTGGATGIHSPKLDAMLNEALAAPTASARASLYKQIGEFMAKNAMADFLYDKPFLWLTTKNVGWIPKYGPTYGEIFWQDVYLTK